MSKTAIAEAMKISRNQLHLIHDKQEVTPDTAVRLAAGDGPGADPAKIKMGCRKSRTLYVTPICSPDVR